VVSDLERIAEQMRAIAAMMHRTSGDLTQEVSQIARQLADLEQAMRGSRHRDQIVPHFEQAVKASKEAIAGLRHAAKLSEDWAATAAGGGGGASSSQARHLPQSEAGPETGPEIGSAIGPEAELNSPSVVRLSTTSPGDKEALASPPPHATIVVDDKFTYQTDEWGRIVRAIATLDARDPDHPRNSTAQRDLPDKGAEDHAGHIFARIFKGPGDLINLVPMHGRKVNLSAYRMLENLWSRTIKAKGEARVEVRFEYLDEGRRPDEIRVRYKVQDSNGKLIGSRSVKIKNKGSKRG
jgi:hypothetical protein